MTEIAYTLFGWIKTPQEMVYQEGVEEYKSRFKNGDDVEPVELIPYGNEFLLHDGNHKSRAAFELGEPGINAVILNSPSTFSGRPKKIEELKVVPRKTEGIVLPKFKW